MYLSVENTTARLVQQTGKTVVALAREGNNYCWERFIEVKEYMHAFDSVTEATDSGNDFDVQLRDLTTAGTVEPCDQMIGEIKAFWRAMGVLCPEHVRQELIAERAVRGQELSDYAIAFRLKIPELYVPNLFEPWYFENLAKTFD
ncbi:MAG TPA: hypothetical protein VGI95_18610 [Caulobacteraceae bacterium]|jgi:hypothetical protein